MAEKSDSDSALARSVAATVAELDSFNDRNAEDLSRIRMYGPAKSLARGESIDNVDFAAAEQLTYTQLSAVAPVLHSTAVWTRWEQQRIVYALHPQLIKELADSESDQLPGNVLDQLPLDHPFVAFGEPMAVANLAGTAAQARGFTLYGLSTKRNCYCDIHDPDRTDIGFHFYITEPDRTTTVCSLVVPTTGVFSVDDVVNGAASDVSMINYSAPDGELDRNWVRDSFSRLLRLGVATTLYLCTRDADVRPAKERMPRRAKERVKGGTRRRDKSATVFEAGWRLGPPLTESRRTSTDGGSVHSAAQSDSDRKRKPHPRKGHFQRYWVGRGDEKTLEVRWKRPIQVNAHLRTGDDNSPYIVPVNKVVDLDALPDDSMLAALASATAAHLDDRIPVVTVSDFSGTPIEPADASAALEEPDASDSLGA
ncbi:hypothetical protein [Nocardia asiatica]|uniref:hypothetical protein n=1 Tax=Nocardia asiatica TaxID=209252 RepID=UPI00030EF124|nr:hypothetical protein [Nocardia asiatica]